MFAQALRDESNRELDWLWVYIQLTDVQQRRYCLERALAINPKSELSPAPASPAAAQAYVLSVEVGNDAIPPTAYHRIWSPCAHRGSNRRRDSRPRFCLAYI